MKNGFKNNYFNKKQLDFLNENSIRSAFDRTGKGKAGIVADLSLGNPTSDFPSKSLTKQIKKILKSPLPRGFFSYMDNAGYKETRKAVALDLVRSNYFSTELSEDNIIMTVGASGAINCILSSILNPLDEVIILSPFFVDYPKYVLNFSGIPITVSLGPPDFDLNLKYIEKAITKRTKALIINSPNNPTGKIYSKESLHNLSILLKRKSREINNSIYLISDEVYREITYDGNEFNSPCAEYDDSIMAYSFSKSLNIPGERIGYAAIHPHLKNGDTLFQLIKFSNRTLGFTNAPSLFQRVVPKILPLKISNKKYQKQKDKLAAVLKEAGFKFNEPEGAFYFFVKLPLNEKKFIDISAKEGLFIVGSKPFGISNYFRMAFCVPEETVDLACRKIIEIGKKINTSSFSA